MKKTLSVLAVALLLALTLTACNPEPAGLTAEDNENLIKYMSRILSAAYEANEHSDGNTFTDFYEEITCFTTGTALITTSSDATTITFNAKMTSETNAVTGTVVMNETDGSMTFENLVFYCGETKYEVSGTGIMADFFGKKNFDFYFFELTLEVSVNGKKPVLAVVFATMSQEFSN